MARGGLAALVARQLIEDGARWEFSFAAGPRLHTSDGRVLDLGGMVEDWDPSSDMTHMARQLVRHGLRGDLVVA